MPERPCQNREQPMKTVTAIGFQAMARIDGRAAIRLETREFGPIAFEVDQIAIDAIRQAIAAAETHLRLSKNQTKN